jgi:hypothetical protein
MSWVPVLGTILGAVIGLGSGLLIDQVWSRRDGTERWLLIAVILQVGGCGGRGGRLLPASQS